MTVLSVYECDHCHTRQEIRSDADAEGWRFIRVFRMGKVPNEEPGVHLCPSCRLGIVDPALGWL